MKRWLRLSGEVRALCAAFRMGIALWRDIHPYKKCIECRWWCMGDSMMADGVCDYCVKRRGAAEPRITQGGKPDCQAIHAPGREGPLRKSMRLRVIGEWLALWYIAKSAWHTSVYVVKCFWYLPSTWRNVRPFVRCLGCKQEWIPSCAVSNYGAQLCQSCREITSMSVGSWRN